MTAMGSVERTGGSPREGGREGEGRYSCAVGAELESSWVEARLAVKKLSSASRTEMEDSPSGERSGVASGMSSEWGGAASSIGS